MKNNQKTTRSGASQASTLNHPGFEEDHPEGNPVRYRTTGTSVGSEDMDDPAQPHTAGGTSSAHPRRVDNQ
ncbi:hypothetical protein [Tellurirhabdus rosea]|uniref:hypothetical protein n=1 Tax=Tellurirhabdus rosea TaxID=2674997 RepID=UPI002253BCBA|nr:hypothetical protein [Tellurirhabdus rosea]